MYFYARDCLLHYAKWMLKNEYPYLEKCEILEFPTETWPAADLKKSCVFLFAFKHSHGELRDLFLEKADFFFKHSMETLYTFDTKSLARPIALILQNGSMYSYFVENPDENVSLTRNKYNYAKPNEFLSIDLIVKQTMKELVDKIKNISLKKEIHWLKCRIHGLI
ncbi:MAG: hypothetical protein ACE5H1_05885 [Thermodesulfobacteriota bacterium]